MATKTKNKAQSKKRASPSIANHDKTLRRQLAEVFTWHEAHVNWKSALADLPAEKRGLRPEGLPHSAWELLEHARITQSDILDFCLNPKYKPL